MNNTTTKLNGFPRWDAERDVFGEVVPLYQCDHCERWFLPGDTHVTLSDGEYCYGDHTGNGCLDKFVDACPHHDPDKLSNGDYHCCRCDAYLTTNPNNNNNRSN